MIIQDGESKENIKRQANSFQEDGESMDERNHQPKKRIQ